MKLYTSARQLGQNCEFSPEEMARVATYGQEAVLRIEDLVAVAGQPKDHIRSVARKAFESYGFKVCAVMRAGIDDVETPTLAEIEQRAASLDPFFPLNETVFVHPEEKDNDTYRWVVDFGWKRRALIEMAVCVLDTVLPTYHFDFLRKGVGGFNGATRHLRKVIEESGYEFVVTADIKDCFGSAIKEKVASMLPLPEKVTKHVLLVRDDVKVDVGSPNDYPGEILEGSSAWLEGNGAARQGLPQGSSASGLILRRAVLGPILAQQTFTEHLILYQDEVAVPVMTEAEAREVLATLKSIFSTSPAGPLTIGRSAIRHVCEGVDFVGYRTERKSDTYGGHLHTRPSNGAFARAEKKALKKDRKAGGGLLGLKAAALHFRRWRPAFGLWAPNCKAKQNQWTSYMAGR